MVTRKQPEVSERRSYLNLTPPPDAHSSPDGLKTRQHSLDIYLRIIDLVGNCNMKIKSSIFVCMWLSALTVSASGCETPRQHTDGVPEAGIVIDPPLLPCENHCEVRFANGECHVNVSCLFAAGEGASSLVSSSFHTESGSSERSFCRGHCVFRDVEGPCRLDLICLLRRDAAATRKFLEQFLIYEETVVEALALTAESARSSGDLKGMQEEEETQHDQQDLSPSSQSPQENEITDDEQGTGSPDHSIVNPPVLPCPGRCEVRNPSNECVVDVDCAAEL
ncbi:uncharacterized protein LOC122267672 [Penaeus japonicus]|uniref:uncharacterized protein LOC122267672 n=1 Tax=Penaeus japonicus TaxID=27405 RepID=UPI001C712D41|nr:uncharacterized protein LOC122267672 [Penaeus japonicus]